VAGGRIHLRQLHDPLAHARLIPLFPEHATKPGLRKEAGLFALR
jgi:hypothetical protein